MCQLLLHQTLDEVIIIDGKIDSTITVQSSLTDTESKDYVVDSAALTAYSY